MWAVFSSVVETLCITGFMQKHSLRASRQTSNRECNVDAEHEVQNRTRRQTGKGTNKFVFCSIYRHMRVDQARKAATALTKLHIPPL